MSLKEMLGGGRQQERVDLKSFVTKYITDVGWAQEFNLEQFMNIHGEDFPKQVSFHSNK